MSDINWSCLPFSALSAEAVYGILRLRAEVFVVEQDCVYQDLDGCDQAALHLCGVAGDTLACYARLLAPGIKYPAAASIGRVVTASAWRGSGVGKALLAEAVRECVQHWPQSAITISAQHYLERFYSSFGFQQESEPYMEDGIPHIRMTRS